MGNAIAYRARCELRSSWRAAVVLSVLLGIAGGSVLLAAAGSRRTASAYPRMFDAALGFDVLVNPDDGDTDFDGIEALPAVERAGRVTGYFIVPQLPSGDPDFASSLLLAVSDGKLGYEFSRPVQLEGRLPGLDRPGEIFLPAAYAEAGGIELGDSFHLLAFLDAESEDAEPEAVPYELTVVGVGVFPTDALETGNAINQTSTALLSPSFPAEIPGLGAAFAGSFVRLRPGESLSAFQAAAAEVAGEELLFQSRLEAQAKAERALRPYSATLAAFAVAAGLASLLILGQALARHLVGATTDRRTLAALGLTPREEIGVTVVRAVVVGLGSAAVAVAVAVAASPLMPIGPARSFEPDRGVDIDARVLLPGALSLVLFTVAIGVISGRRSSRSLRALASTARGSAIVRWLAGGADPTVAAGARMALEPGTGARAVPVRTTLTGAVFGVAVIVAVLTFAGALDQFLATPRYYGWNWDAMVVLNTGSGDALRGTVEAVDGVASATAGEFGQVRVEELSVAAIGLEAGGVELSLLDGRSARADDEVVLGATTLRRIGRHLGDRISVSAGDRRREMTVVGTVTFPRFAAYPGADKTGLGDGAALTQDGLNDLLPPTIGDDGGADFFLVDVDRAGALDEMASTFPQDEDLEAAGILLLEPQRPDDLTGYERVNRTPLFLAALLGLLAAGATAHGVLLATRRRRHDLAVMRALGFTGGQVRRTVWWQAVTIALIALVVGLPLGVAAGRVTWTALAERLGTAAPPVTPWLAVLTIAPAVVLLLVAVSALPAHRTATISPAEILRAE